MEYYFAFLSLSSIIFISLIICAAMACIPAGIARDKGHPFGIWWFYGFLLFPFALIHSSLIQPADASSTSVSYGGYFRNSYVNSYSCSSCDAPEVSAWGYVGLSVLWSIPIIGWIFWICTAMCSSNMSKRNYACSYFCTFLLAIILLVVLAAVVIILVAMGVIPEENIYGLLSGTTA